MFRQQCEPVVEKTKRTRYLVEDRDLQTQTQIVREQSLTKVSDDFDLFFQDSLWVHLWYTVRIKRGRGTSPLPCGMTSVPVDGTTSSSWRRSTGPYGTRDVVEGKIVHPVNQTTPQCSLRYDPQSVRHSPKGRKPCSSDLTGAPLTSKRKSP